jgi:hypothetical protein
VLVEDRRGGRATTEIRATTGGCPYIGYPLEPEKGERKIYSISDSGYQYLTA